MHTDELFHTREAFAEMASRPNETIEIDRAALLIAAEEYPDLSLEPYLQQLDELADRIRLGLYEDAGPRETLVHLNRVLFEDEGFHGNTERYYDPKNSYLNEVLERRTGIPITLSALYLEIARRVGLSLHGVGFPGHFLVKVDPGVGVDVDVVVDPFHGGRFLDEKDLQSLLDQYFQGQLRYSERLLRPTSRRQLLFRMLNNLRGIHLRQDDNRRALAAVDRMLLLVPDSPREIRDKGVLLSRLDRPLEAMNALIRYRRLIPKAEDAAQVDELIEQLKMRVGMAN